MSAAPPPPTQQQQQQQQQQQRAVFNPNIATKDEFVAKFNQMSRYCDTPLLSCCCSCIEAQGDQSAEAAR